MLSTVAIPHDPADFEPKIWLAFIENTAHVYTDASIRDELEQRGAPADFIERALELAGEVRARADRRAA